MTGANRDQDLLRYIHESIVLIEQYIQGGRDVFLATPMVQDAVLRRLETLADAASHLSDSLKTRHPRVPWRDIAGFRNVAAHGYLVLDLRRAWTTVETRLPALRSAVDEELGYTRST